MRSESQARDTALRFLYHCDIRGDLRFSSVKYQQFISNFLSEESGRFCQKLCRGVLDNRLEIDKMIESCSENWRLKRMARIDCALLRVGTFELSAMATPLAVVINETIELAKRYGTGDSSAFVNGIIDTIGHEIGEGKWQIQVQGQF